MSEGVVSLLSGPNFAQLGTINSDGTPHIDTVWFGCNDNELVVATTMSTKKARNLTTNPDEDMQVCDAIALSYTGKEFPQRGHKNRVAIYLEIVSCKYHIARV